MTKTPRHNAAWRALSRGYIRTRIALEDALKAENLPGLDVMDALAALNASDKDLIAKALETELVMPQYGVSRLLDRMEKDGLVKRVAHPSDHRVKLLHLTEQGRATFLAMSKTKTRALADFFGPRAKPGQLDRMADLLTLLDQDAASAA